MLLTIKGQRSKKIYEHKMKKVWVKYLEAAWGHITRKWVNQSYNSLTNQHICYISFKYRFNMTCYSFIMKTRILMGGSSTSGSHMQIKRIKYIREREREREIVCLANVCVYGKRGINDKGKNKKRLHCWKYFL
jgi:hypothetical protein